MSKDHVSLRDLAAEVSGWVCDAVDAVSNLGFTREHAVQNVSERFGVSPGTLRRMLYGEIFKINPEEHARLKKEHHYLLGQEQEKYKQRALAISARRARLGIDDADDPLNRVKNNQKHRDRTVGSMDANSRVLGRSRQVTPATDPNQWALANLA